MLPVTLHFQSLPDLALFAKNVSGNGFQINIQNLTLKTKLTEAEIKQAKQKWKVVVAAPL